MNKNAAILNERIKAKTVLLILDDGSNRGEVPLGEAIYLANSKGLDLWQVSTTNNIPTCKIVDFGKLMYEQVKKTKQNKKDHKLHETKEIKVSYHIGDHDLATKHKIIHKLLAKKHKILYTLELGGRRECFMIKEAMEKINNSLSEFLEDASWDDPQLSPIKTKGYKQLRTITTTLKPKI